MRSAKDTTPTVNKIIPDNDIDKSLHNTWSKILKPEWIEVKPDDIFITSHPKSGTNVLQEMVWLVANDFDFERAKTKIYTRVSYMEIESVYPSHVWYDMIQTRPYLDIFEGPSNDSPRRIFKTHNPFNLLPRQIREDKVQPKIINIIRDPKDVCVSFYHYSKTINDFYGTFDEFSEQFMAGRVYYGPYWGQVFSYWNQRTRSNILIIRYEEMNTNMPKVLRKVAEFLEKDVTDEQISLTVEYLSFKRLCKNKYVHYEDLLENVKPNGEDDLKYKKLEGKCEVGVHKKMMTTEMIEKFDKWIDDNVKGSDLDFERTPPEKSSCILL